MLIVIGSMLGGVVIGYLLRRVPNLFFIKKLPLFFIILLLLALGISVGANKLIINNLSSIGIQALIITGGAVFFSLILIRIFYFKYFKEKEEQEE